MVSGMSLIMIKAAVPLFSLLLGFVFVSAPMAMRHEMPPPVPVEEAVPVQPDPVEPEPVEPDEAPADE